MEKVIKVNGMHCKSCEILLSDSISEIKGVQKVSADSTSGVVKVTYSNEGILNDIKTVIEKEGYKVIN